MSNPGRDERQWTEEKKEEVEKKKMRKKENFQVI